MAGMKNDRKDGKPRWELLPLPLLEQIVNVYTFGAQKYAENSWQDLPDGGEITDKESGLPHLAHMAWNALAVLYFGTIKQQQDDQPTNKKKKPRRRVLRGGDKEKPIA